MLRFYANSGLQKEVKRGKMGMVGMSEKNQN